MTTMAINPDFGNDDAILFKAVGNTTIDIDEAKGIVEAFAAAIGNKDSVNDIVAPGAFDASLSRRKPRVVWGHNWNEPIGKVLEIREVGSGDPRLPSKMRQASVGGLYVKVQFNLKSERGREAFASVGFFGEDQEWSIGYKTLRADYDPSRGANILKEVELYEVSPVLHGANQLTGTISVKDAQGETVSMVWDESDDRWEKAHHDEDEKKGLAGLIHRAVAGVFGPSARIRMVEGNRVVFTRGEGEMYQTTFSIEKPRVTFTPPVRARMRTIVEPIGPQVVPEMEHKPMLKEDEPEAIVLPETIVQPEAREGTIEILDNGTTSTTFSISNSNVKWDFSDGGITWSDSSGTAGTVYDIETEGKAGRVLRRGNMDSLRQAMELIEQVMASGLREEVESKSLADMYREEAVTEGLMVAGQPEAVLGMSLDIPVEDSERTEAILDALETHIDELNLAVVAPGEKAFTEGPSNVSVYLSSADNVNEQIETLAGALSNIDGDFSVSVDKKDFFGELKSFEEVFPETKVLK